MTDRVLARHQAAARLNEKVWLPDELRALAKDRRERGTSIDRKRR